MEMLNETAIRIIEEIPIETDEQKIRRAYLMVLTFMVKIGALLKLFNIVA